MIDYPFNLMREIGCPVIVDPQEAAGVFKERVEDALHTLLPREKIVIEMRFKENKKLETIGNYLGVTRERVKQIINKAIRRLKNRNSNEQFYTCYDKIRELQQEVEDKERELNNKLFELSQTIEKINGINIGDLIIKEIGTCPEIGLDKPLEDLDLSVRAYNCLKRSGVETLRQITARSEEDLMKVRNLGRKAIKEIVLMLREYNLHLRGYNDNEY